MNKYYFYYNAVPTGLMVIVWLFNYQSIASSRLNSKTQTSVYSEVILEQTRGDNFLKEAREVQQMTSPEIDIVKEVAYAKTPSSVRAELILEDLEIEYFEHPIKKDRNVSLARKGNNDEQSPIEQLNNDNLNITNPIVIYPNPVQNKISINIKLNENTKYEFYLYDLVGQLVYKTLLKENKSVDLSSVKQKGIYLYKLTSENTFDHTGKVIICR